MRNIWLIIQREYLARVRTRSFLVLTLLLPGIMTVLMMLPAKLATMGDKTQHLVVVTSNPQLGEIVRQTLSTPDSDDDDDSTSDSKASKTKPEQDYTIDVDPNPTDAERAVLRDKVSSKAIDGYLWLSDDAIASGKVTWTS